MTISTLTPAQLEAHYKFIGGSTAPIVAGLSPWESPYERYLIMRGELPPKDLSDNEAVEFGNRLEDTIAQAYSDRTGRKVRRSTQTLVSKEHPFIVAHVDRLIVGERRGLECKNTRYGHKEDWGPSGSTLIPKHYLCQCQHYMYVTGYDMWDLAALVGGNNLRIYPIPRDQEFIDLLVTLEVDFWRRLKEGDPPPPTTLDDVDLRWKESVGTPIEATATIVTMTALLEAARTAMKDAKTKEENLKLAIATFMGEHDTIEDGGNPILTYRDQFERRVDTTALQDKYPSVWADEAVRPESRKRVMRIVKERA